MNEISSIHTFEDKAFLKRMTNRSIATVAVGVVLGIAWFALDVPGRIGLAGSELGAVFIEGTGPRPFGLPPSTLWLLLGAVGCFISLGVHELVHGLLFLLFAPRGSRVTFGVNWKAGMLYACAEGVVYRRRHYLVIVLGPTVVLTVGLLAASSASAWPVLWYTLAVLHLSGCTGDWGYVGAIVRDRRIAYCEDTDWGVRFFDDALDGDEFNPKRGGAR